ncbi:MAG TPA: ATP-binding protein [Candidatus Thermoplasmatota archaeon]|nr:ATP-binding protein [Candidatus Thermoplasmatota archaeon]
MKVARPRPAFRGWEAWQRTEGPLARAPPWIPFVLAPAVLADALLVAWLLSPGRAAVPASLRLVLGLLALAPLASGFAFCWLLARTRAAPRPPQAPKEPQAPPLAAMGHEMRASLAAVAGFSDLLGKTPLTPDQATHVDCIRASSAHLLAVVDRAVADSRPAGGGGPPLALQEAPFEANALARACAQTVSLAAAAKGLRLTVNLRPEPLHLHGDATRMRQVLLNLLSNAVKFTPAGTVTLTLRAGRGPADQVAVLFEVRDTGVGIAESDLGRLFLPYSRVGSQKAPGTGLGLALSRQLCRRMGGDLTVRSRAGAGSTFTASFLLRAALPPPPQRTPANAAPPAARGDLAILLAEDNVMNQRLALRVLAGLGHAADLATDGAQAVAMAGRGHYDVVLMDVHMPALDGLLATQALHGILPPGQLPFVIGLTAGALPEDRERCLRAGMDAHLPKPVDAAPLAVLLEAARERRKARAVAAP